MKKGTLLGFLVIALFLSLLAIVPELTRKKEVVIKGPEIRPELKQFPLDKSFTIVTVDSAKKVSTGKSVTLASLFTSERKTLLINFWATWCAPCLEELPSLEHLARQLKSASNRPLVVAISVDEKVADIAALMPTLEFVPSFLILHDPNGDFSTSIGTSKFPETFWVGEGGNILHKWAGPQDWLSREVLLKLSSRG